MNTENTEWLPALLPIPRTAELVTVHQRGTRWYYRLDLESGPLTGERQRENRCGFETRWTHGRCDGAHAAPRHRPSGPGVPADGAGVRSRSNSCAATSRCSTTSGPRPVPTTTPCTASSCGTRTDACCTRTRRRGGSTDWWTWRGAVDPGLHDVRHPCAALALDGGVHAEILDDRIGHAHEGITVQIDGHRSTGHDRGAAELWLGSSARGWTHRMPTPGRAWSQIWPHRRRNGLPGDPWKAVPSGSGDRIRTCDLWVMSPASYRAAPPRAAFFCCAYDCTPPGNVLAPGGAPAPQAV